jgi:hypothetical protein
VLWFKRTDAVTDTANMLDISCGSVCAIIHEDLRYYEIWLKWVPKQLTDESKWAHTETCEGVSKSFQTELIMK